MSLECQRAVCIRPATGSLTESIIPRLALVCPGQMFEFCVDLPGGGTGHKIGDTRLDLEVWDWDMLTSDDLIGATSFNLEDRFYSEAWRELGKCKVDEQGNKIVEEQVDLQGNKVVDGTTTKITKPIEWRTLHTKGSKTNRGQVRCWLDILTKEEAAANPAWDIAKPAADWFEMRMVIWHAKGMPIMVSA